jgi:UDP-N-acetylmuramyl tripeptide synthase
MLGAKVAAARAAGALARVTGRGGGTSLPGKLLLRLEPHAIGELARRLPQGSAVISATNGKTTSAAMVASILGGAGRTLVHNRAGANMAGGVATALLEATRRGRGIDGELGLFEVDEFWLERVADEVEPRAMLLANLFRDQLDRFGELELIAERWAEVVRARAGRTALCLNADDPLVADLGMGLDFGVTYFGVEDERMALPGLQHASDSKHCRRCGQPYDYVVAFLGHLGHYRCPHCGHARPAPQVAAERVELHGTRSAGFTLRTPEGSTTVALPLPGLYNVYNALGAASLALALGATLDEVKAGLEAVSPAFGRAQAIDLGDRELVLLLVKNPAGANEVLRTLALEPGELDLLCVLNDRIADGRDVSWVWDADTEVIAPKIRRATCAGTRAAEMALRLKYAGVPADRIEVVDELPAALDRAAATATGTLFAMPTYTALLELHDLLADRGQAPRYWA